MSYKYIGSMKGPVKSVTKYKHIILILISYEGLSHEW